MLAVVAVDQEMLFLQQVVLVAQVVVELVEVNLLLLLEMEQLTLAVEAVEELHQVDHLIVLETVVQE